MENLIEMTVLTSYIEKYLTDWLTLPFSYGLLVGAALELLGYGIFKAVSLLNIK